MKIIDKDYVESIEEQLQEIQSLVNRHCACKHDKGCPLWSKKK